MRLVVTDIETTGISPAEGAEIIEIAWVIFSDGEPDPLKRGVGPFGFENYAKMMCKNTRPIPYEASAVHHLLDEDLESAGPLAGAMEMYEAEKGVRVAHNSSYEALFLPGHQWLCTFKVAKRLWPDLKSHSNQAIRYRLGLIHPLGMDRSTVREVHRALPDALVTSAILLDMLEAGVSIEDMLAWTSQPTYIPTCPLKKYKGKKWEDVPTDYLEWMARASDMDPDLLHWARAELARR